MINKTGLTNIIQSCIDKNTFTSTKDTFAQAYAASLDSGTDRSTSVPNVDALPDATTMSTGQTVFVESINSFAIASNGEWIDLKQRVIRNDNVARPVLFAWGLNGVGQFGNLTTVGTGSPVTMGSAWHSDWKSVSNGVGHTAAIKSDNTLWTWGVNNLGQLGDGTVICRSSPVSVVGGFNDWCQVSVLQQSAGIRTNGTLWVWGLNQGGSWCGTLGDGTTTNKSSPVSVVGGITNWCYVSVGEYDLFSGGGGNFMLALRTDGTAWAWGTNNRAQLGDGTCTFRTSPVPVAGGQTFKCIWPMRCGLLSSSFGLTTSNTLWGWGFNFKGSIGDGTSAARTTPVSVVGGFTDWVSANPGDSVSVGLRGNGTLWAWGYNSSGMLGQGTTTYSGIYAASSPISVIGGFTDWCQVGTDKYHTIALRANGTLWSWGGRGNTGVLGDGACVDRSSPIQVAGNLTWACIASVGPATVTAYAIVT